MTGMDTALTMPSIRSGSLIRATPPWARMSAGTRSRAITATAPASSAILAWSAVTTSMMTPPLSISAMPRFTRAVPVTEPFWLPGPAGVGVDTTDLIQLSGKGAVALVHGRAAVTRRMAGVSTSDALACSGGQRGWQLVVDLERLRQARVTGEMRPSHDPLPPDPLGVHDGLVVEPPGELGPVAGRREPVEDAGPRATGADRGHDVGVEGQVERLGQVTLCRLPLCRLPLGRGRRVGRGLVLTRRQRTRGGRRDEQAARRVEQAGRREFHRGLGPADELGVESGRPPSTRWCSRSSRAAEKERYQARN